MTQQGTRIAFDEDHAAVYDEQFAKLTPLKDALHLCMRAALADASSASRVLCVGAGTGAEVCYLADAYPDWTFTLVEPAAPMLARARHKAEEAGIADRCTFHVGYLDSLPESGLFDVATSILVSQFVLDPKARRDFFRGIAARLLPGGQLITADLATRANDDPSDRLFLQWLALMRHNNSDEEVLKNYRNAIQKGVAVVPPATLATLLTESGFEQPLSICQTLLIHTWHARRAMKKDLTA